MIIDENSKFLEMKSIQPYSTKDEYLFAMKEDLAEWFNSMYSTKIGVFNFIEQLETGVLICLHANNVLRAVISSNSYKFNQSDLILSNVQNIPSQLIIKDKLKKKLKYKQSLKTCSSNWTGDYLLYTPDARPQSFQSRDNISNFIKWCRHICKVRECLMFETDDLILRKNEKNFILCLLEIARFGSKFGLTVPNIIKLEQEIEAQIERELNTNKQSNQVESKQEILISNSINSLNTSSLNQSFDDFNSDTNHQLNTPINEILELNYDYLQDINFIPIKELEPKSRETEISSNYLNNLYPLNSQIETKQEISNIDCDDSKIKNSNNSLNDSSYDLSELKQVILISDELEDELNDHKNVFTCNIINSDSINNKVELKETIEETNPLETKQTILTINNESNNKPNNEQFLNINNTFESINDLVINPNSNFNQLNIEKTKIVELKNFSQELNLILNVEKNECFVANNNFSNLMHNPLEYQINNKQEDMNYESSVLVNIDENLEKVLFCKNFSRDEKLNSNSNQAIKLDNYGQDLEIVEKKQLDGKETDLKTNVKMEYDSNGFDKLRSQSQIDNKQEFIFSNDILSDQSNKSKNENLNNKVVNSNLLKINQDLNLDNSLNDNLSNSIKVNKLNDLEQDLNILQKDQLDKKETDGLTTNMNQVEDRKSLVSLNNSLDNKYINKEENLNSNFSNKPLECLNLYTNQLDIAKEKIIEFKNYSDNLDSILIEESKTQKEIDSEDTSNSLIELQDEKIEQNQYVLIDKLENKEAQNEQLNNQFDDSILNENLNSNSTLNQLNFNKIEIDNSNDTNFVPNEQKDEINQDVDHIENEENSTCFQNLLEIKVKVNSSKTESLNTNKENVSSNTSIDDLSSNTNHVNLDNNSPDLSFIPIENKDMTVNDLKRNSSIIVLENKSNNFEKLIQDLNQIEVIKEVVISKNVTKQISVIKPILDENVNTKTTNLNELKQEFNIDNSISNEILVKMHLGNEKIVNSSLINEAANPVIKISDSSFDNSSINDSYQDEDEEDEEGLKLNDTLDMIEVSTEKARNNFNNINQILVYDLKEDKFEIKKQDDLESCLFNFSNSTPIVQSPSSLSSSTSSLLLRTSYKFTKQDIDLRKPLDKTVRNLTNLFNNSFNINKKTISQTNLLHKNVCRIVERCKCDKQLPCIKIGEGKYRIGNTKNTVFIRVLRNHVMVRVGGGWDTLENYLNKNDPCRSLGQQTGDILNSKTNILLTPISSTKQTAKVSSKTDKAEKTPCIKSSSCVNFNQQDNYIKKNLDLRDVNIVVERDHGGKHQISKILFMSENQYLKPAAGNYLNPNHYVINNSSRPGPIKASNNRF